MRELGDDVTYGQTHTRTQPFIVKDKRKGQLMTNNHTADVGAIYRNILIDLPARGKGRKSGIEFQTCLRSTDCVVPFSKTGSLVLSLVNLH